MWRCLQDAEVTAAELAADEEDRAAEASLLIDIPLHPACA